MLVTLLLTSSIARAGDLAPHDICTAVSGVNCGGGHDLVPLKNATVVATPEECCAICQKTPQCTAWTWNGPHGNNMCYPKTACTKVGHGNGRVSGSILPIPPVSKKRCLQGVLACCSLPQRGGRCEHVEQRGRRYAQTVLQIFGC